MIWFQPEQIFQFCGTAIKWKFHFNYMRKYKLVNQQPQLKRNLCGYCVWTKRGRKGRKERERETVGSVKLEETSRDVMRAPHSRIIDTR